MATYWPSSGNSIERKPNVVRRILLVLSVAALMAAMLVATAMPAFAQVKRGECKDFLTVETPFGFEDVPLHCRQGVLLPDKPVGNVYDGFGQASSSCGSKGFENSNPRSGERGGKASDHTTFAFVHCFEGPEPII